MKARVVALIETAKGKYARFFILDNNHQPGSQFIFDLPDNGYQIGDKVWFTPNKIIRKLSAPEDHTACPHDIEKYIGVFKTPVVLPEVPGPTPIYDRDKVRAIEHDLQDAAQGDNRFEQTDWKAGEPPEPPSCVYEPSPDDNDIPF